MLNKTFRIRIADGRTLIGVFLCTDKDQNIILGQCQEFVKSNGTEHFQSFTIFGCYKELFLLRNWFLVRRWTRKGHLVDISGGSCYQGPKHSLQ